MNRIVVVIFSSFVLSNLLTGCGGSDKSDDKTNDEPILYSIGGVIQGVNGDVGLTLSADGQSHSNEIFSGDGLVDVSVTLGELESGIIYSVEVSSQPAGQFCSVASGNGTLSANILDIVVSCEDTNVEPELFSISGVIQGINGEIELALSAGGQSHNEEVFSGDGSVDVSVTLGELELGVIYSVEISTQPIGQVCTVASGSGTVSTNVVDIVVACEELAAEKTGYFIDSPVAGLPYFTDTIEGVTDDEGAFNYLPEESVTFVIGTMQLQVAQITDTGILSPLNVFDAENTDDRRVVNFARLLQTIDIAGTVEDGISVDTALLNEHGFVIDFDVPTETFGNDQNILAFVNVVNPLRNPTQLVTAEVAKAHLDNQLALIDSCSSQRTYSLTSVETIIPVNIGEAAQNQSLGGATLSVSKTGVCSLSAPEGWSSSCSISGSLINAGVLSGTIANGSVTLVSVPTLSKSPDEENDEYVSVYFNGNSNSTCSTEEVNAGSYNYSGTEGVSSNDGSGEETYSVTGTIIVGEDSCQVSSSEGDFSCQVSGNQITGLGEASGIRGTITNERVTMYFNSQGEDELVVGYFNGIRN